MTPTQKKQKLEEYNAKLEAAKSILLEAKTLAEELDLVFDLDSLNLLGTQEDDNSSSYDSSDWDDSGCTF